MYETSIGIIIFKVNECVEFLLLQRSNDDLWDFPKGHYQDNNKLESEMTVALRELDEETQIKNVELFDKFRYEYKFINPKGSHRQIILFLGKSQENPILSDEHKQFRWVNFTEACRLLEYKEKIGLLKEAKKFLIKKLDYTF